MWDEPTKSHFFHNQDLAAFWVPISGSEWKQADQFKRYHARGAYSAISCSEALLKLTKTLFYFEFEL